MHARVEALRSDRKRLLAEANRELSNGDDRRAIALYRRILLEEPRNTAVALRAAPLLARRGQSFEAWQLFRMASQELMRARRREECLAALREACRFVPHEFEAWRLRAELELKLGREDAALETLLEGRRAFQGAHQRAQAIALLERARAIEPWEVELGLDLAALYARADQAHAALELLDLLALRGDAGDRRRICALRVRITYAPRDAWAWLRSLLGEPAVQPLADELPVLDLIDPLVPVADPERRHAETTLPLVDEIAPGEDEEWGAAPRVTH